MTHVRLAYPMSRLFGESGLLPALISHSGGTATGIGQSIRMLTQQLRVLAVSQVKVSDKVAGDAWPKI
jgi:hypothetical protein